MKQEVNKPQERWSLAGYQLTCPTASENEINISVVAGHKAVQSV